MLGRNGVGGLNHYDVRLGKKVSYSMRDCQGLEEQSERVSGPARTGLEGRACGRGGAARLCRNEQRSKLCPIYSIRIVDTFGDGL
jgi:hypothetical protein